MKRNYLILDFGNTYQKCALVSDDKFVVHVFENIQLTDLQNLVRDKNISSVILSSVINYSDQIRKWLDENFYFIELSHKTLIPIKNLYKTPETLGKDRLAAAVAANSLFPNANVLSIDCGTAIKYDFVNESGEYLGGGISPGMHLRFKALHTFTDKLPLVSFSHFPDLIGDDTFSAISSGVANGVVAEIEGIIGEYMANFQKLNIVLTGGELIYFEKRLKSSIFADPNLVLKGLYQILKFNEQNNCV